MIRYNVLYRNYRTLYKRLAIQKLSTTSSSSSSSSGSDDEKAKDKQKSLEAREKLNLLLTQMIKNDVVNNKQSTLDLAKPKSQRRKDVRTEPGTESVKNEVVSKEIVKAVKDVAESIGGDIKQTESELLQKLLNPVKGESAQSTAANLGDLFKDMKIDRESKAAEDVSRSQQVRQLLQTMKSGKQQPPLRTRGTTRRVMKTHQDEHLVEERVNLFGDKRLNIFSSPEDMKTWPEQNYNKTWKTLDERELRLAVTHPPSNYFQQMILWTEQGKIWKFPIDNEQGLEAEKSIYFTEHVFLEKHLEPWCPPKGPLRHFMELVCVGLSKNPYLTVEDKKEHIMWFRNYFNEKKELLLEIGAIPSDFNVDQNKTKKIDA